MAATARRDGFHTVTPYLLVSGADRLVEFISEAFGGAVTMRMERPEGGGIMHAEMRIGDSMVMLADPPADHPAMPSMIFLYVDDVDATYAAALKAGATEVRGLRDEDHGDRMGGLLDPVGNQWWMATPLKSS